MGWIADLLKEIPSAARYKAELEDMEEENRSLKSEIHDLQEKYQKVLQELNDLTASPDTPPKDLDFGAETVLASLMNNPSGILARDISQGSNPRISINDVICHFDEFRSYGFVEIARADADNGCEYRLTPKGRDFARRYFAD